jgi:capsular polysaccharide biosynthesis protein
VPRLQGVAAYTKETGVVPTIIVPEAAPPFVRETLAFFGHTTNVSEWTPDSEMHVRKMVVPSNRYPERFGRMAFWKQKNISPDAAAWLHERGQTAVDSVDIELSPRVLISRADFGRREIANRDEVEASLAARGFVTYELVRMSVTEQAALFAQAEHVVGVHGAGLVNMLFSNNCKITEIFGVILKPSYYYLSQCASLN